MRTFLALLIVAVALGASACTAIQPVSPSADSTAGNGATGSMPGMDHGSMAMNGEVPVDAMFIDSMIPHHQGAVEMAEAALESAEHEEIRTMAQAIISSQQAEIEQMENWRNEWFPDLAATEDLMPMGEMSIREDEEKPFDQRFMEAMIPHHQGAIHMAEMALANAEHEEIRTIAQAIIDAQQAEIEQMHGWLAEWYSVNQ